MTAVRAALTLTDELWTIKGTVFGAPRHDPLIKPVCGSLQQRRRRAAQSKLKWLSRALKAFQHFFFVAISGRRSILGSGGIKRNEADSLLNLSTGERENQLYNRMELRCYNYELGGLSENTNQVKPMGGTLCRSAVGADISAVTRHRC